VSALPRETVTINLTSRPTHEAAAMFLSWVAYPDDPPRRKQFDVAMCRAMLMDFTDSFPDEPQRQRMDVYQVVPKEAERALQKGWSSIFERIIAARWYAPYLSNRLTDNQALYALPALQAVSAKNGKQKWKWDADKDPPIKNVIKRIFVPSRPVLHAAFVLGTLPLSCEIYDKLPDFDILLWGDADFFREVIIEGAEKTRIAMIGFERSDGKPRFPDGETIEFVVA
jgi:hypothetical protein